MAMCGVRGFPSVGQVSDRAGAFAPGFPALPVAPRHPAENSFRINVAETAKAPLDMTAAAVEATPHADPEGWKALRIEACAFF
ncbi:MAG: hypothetical protein LBI59_06015 [Candidatus Accumulibacter sp.]|jgi:hypothetical protein|nr:hypothetical protein [Accumulibacter sp.]